MTSHVASFHPNSAAAICLAPLDRVSSSLDALVQTLQTSTTFTQLPSIADDVFTADRDLTQAVELLRRHQANYTRILEHRQEAKELDENIKTIIRRARQLREDITNIHPGIDDDGSDIEIDGDGPPTVDYEQLLQFASRIGKHNTLAKHEAEAEGARLKIKATEARRKSEALQAAMQQTNGIATTARTTNADEQAAPEGEVQTWDLIEAQATDLANRATAFEASSRLPFPPPEALRQGALGRLDLIREGDPGDPDGAVEREVERMVRETENVTSVPSVVTETKVELVRRPEPSQTSTRGPSQAAISAQSAPQAPSKPKKKLDLDFPGADSDDDDDD